MVNISTGTVYILSKHCPFLIEWMNITSLPLFHKCWTCFLSTWLWFTIRKQVFKNINIYRQEVWISAYMHKILIFTDTKWKLDANFMQIEVLFIIIMDVICNHCISLIFEMNHIKRLSVSIPFFLRPVYVPTISWDIDTYLQKQGVIKNIIIFRLFLKMHSYFHALI